MRIGVNLFLALRGLRESTLSSVLMVTAVALGIGFQVASAANLEGYRSEILDQGIGSGFGDVRLRPRRGAGFSDAETLLERVRHLPDVIEAVPIIGTPGTLSTAGHTNGLSVFGVDPHAKHHPYRIIAGQPLDDSGDNLLLGGAFADRLGIAVGDRVEIKVLLSTYPRLVLDDSGWGTYVFHVRGLVGFGASEAAFLPRGFLAREMGNDRFASSILLHARDHFAVAGILEAARSGVPEATVRDWADDSPYLRSSARAVQKLGWASQAMGILAVGVPILALLYVNTLNRRRQIGLLTAMGFQRLDLFVIFLLQALLIGTIGLVVGISIALGTVRYLEAHPLFDWQSFVIRPVITMADLTRLSLAIVATVLAAGSYPAWRAARLNPSRILRGIE